MLGHTEMDEVHAEFEALLDSPGSCADVDLRTVLDALIDHLSHHFSLEDVWMAQEEIPAGDCHAAEHAAVLQSAAQVRSSPMASANSPVCGHPKLPQARTVEL